MHVYSIPWYVVLFVSIPETFLIIILGFKLYNLKVDLRKVLSVSIIVGIIAYFVRQLQPIFGIHTVVLFLSTIILISILNKTKLLYSSVAVITAGSVRILLEAIILPIVFSLAPLTLNELASDKQWLNVILFWPTGAIMLGLYFYATKKRFTIVDLGLVTDNNHLKKV